MKKIIISFFIILLGLSLVSCKQSNITDDLIIDIGESTKFTKEEITEAVDLVKNNFDFPAANLTKIRYDEELSDSILKDDFEKGVDPKIMIIILSEFDVDGSGDNPVLNPNSTYTDYMWILKRDRETSKWIIDDCGYW